MKTFFTILFIISTAIAFSQEICDNGIDDDGDGLIDLNDVDDCECELVFIESLIPNPSFEEHSCCPNDLSQLDCADTWIQAGVATSDYFNTCDFTNGSPMPYPDGEAVVGMFFCEDWSEYVGACLTSPMISGTSYKIKFNAAFNTVTGSQLLVCNNSETFPPINLTIYGTANCMDLPFPYSDACPVGYGGWQELGYVTVNPNDIEGSWGEYSITFNPDFDINAIVLGPPCQYPISNEYDISAYCGPYFYVDNLVLNESNMFGLVINDIGSYCSNNLSLTAVPDTIGTFQWYYQGIALLGETNETIDISGNSYPAGEYQVVFTADTFCKTSEFVVELLTPEIDDINNISACNSFALPQITGVNLSGNENFYSEPGGIGTPISSSITTSQTIYIYDSNGSCYDETSFVVDIHNPIVVNDIPNTSACISYNLPEITGTNLTGNENFYTASNGGGSIVSSTITSTMTIYIYDSDGVCSDQESFTVSIQPLNINDIADQSACSTYNLPTITGISLSGNQNYYSAPNGGGSIISSPITTSQTIYIFDQEGACSDEESFYVTIFTPPQIDNLPAQTSCDYFNLPTITGTNLSGNQNYYLAPNGVGNIVTSPISYSQTIYIYDTQGSCSDQTSFTITIINTPIIDNIEDEISCESFDLMSITGINLTGTENYYTQSGGNGSIVDSHVTTSQTIFAYAENGNCFDEDEFSVTINKFPIITDIPDNSACINYNLPNITGLFLSGNQNFYSGPNGTGSVVTSPVNSTQTIYIFDSNGDCSDEESFEIIIEPQVFAYAGEDIIVCGNTAEVSAQLFLPDSEGFWTGPGVFDEASSPQTNVHAGIGTFVYTWREEYGTCWDTDEVNVTFLEIPNPIMVNNVDSVCQNTCNLSVTSSGFNGIWTAYSGNPPELLNPAPIYIPSATSPMATATIGNFTQNIKDVTFVWTETNQQFGVECTTNVSTDVSFIKQPFANVGPDNEEEICGICFDGLNADITGSEWADGLWISPNANCTWTNAESPQAEVCFNEPGIFGDSAHFRTPLIWTVSNYFCTDLDTLWVTIYDRPEANAGLDGSICGLNYNLEAFFDITENLEYSPSGIWSVFSGPIDESADFNTVYDSNPTVSVSATGIWEFAFRENNSFLTSCYDTDIVSIEFVEVPVISAGDDAEVCGKTAVLNAVSGGFTGVWLNIPGANYEDYSNPNTVVHVGENSTFTFVWLESNQATTSSLACTSTDAVQITFWTQPEATILTDEEDNTACGRRFLNLRAELPGTDIRGYWYDTYPGTIYENYDSVSTWAEVYTFGCHDFYWIEESGPELNPGFCTDTAGPLNICFIEVPTANAGNDTLFCGLLGSLDAIPSIGTGVWTTPSHENIEIIDPNNPNSDIISYVYNTDEESEDHFTLLWTEDNGNGCTDTDEVEVVFARIPQSETTVIPPKCFGEEATIAAQDVDLTQYSWNFYSGNVNSILENTSGGTFLNMVSWDDNEESHIFSLLTTNLWGCQSPISIDTIYEPVIPNFGITITSDTCLMGKGGLIFNETENNSFFWMDSLHGPTYGGAFTQVYNLPAGIYQVSTSYLTPNIENYAYYLSTFGTANCIDTLYYQIEPIGLIDAEMLVSADIILENLVAPEANVVFINNSEYDDVSKRCEWHFDDGIVLKSCDDMIEHTYIDPGCYSPYLIVMNRDLPECRDTAYLDACIFVDNSSKLEIPNIFSPNGDGVNDYFQVKAQTLRTFSGIILNRWGRTIFEWTDWTEYTSGWDGKINGKSNASPGVYYYIIKAEGLDGTPYDEHGAFHLMNN